MAKYHIGKDGTPRECLAQIKCRLGEDTIHFPTREDALKFSEQYLAKTNSTLPTPTVRKRAPKAKFTPQEIAAYEKQLKEMQTQAQNQASLHNTLDKEIMELAGVVGVLKKKNLAVNPAIYEEIEDLRKNRDKLFTELQEQNTLIKEFVKTNADLVKFDESEKRKAEAARRATAIDRRSYSYSGCGGGGGGRSSC